ncbi:MAG: J domain-containing protein [Clostridiales bacterium]|nr:J domain-containing protein [Clostridiales bacterium]
MTDPYKELGVSEDATDDEIKQAYRALVKKYHPDNYASDPDLKQIAEDKMKAVNSAYDEIQKLRKTGQTSSSESQAYSAPEYDYSAYNGEYIHIRELINAGDISMAESLLLSVSAEKRGAEWNFLMGAVFIKRGFYFDALNYIKNACYMDPYNPEYRSALNRLNRQSSFSADDSEYTVTHSGCDTLLGACCLGDCLCGICGNNLCSCC